MVFCTFEQNGAAGGAGGSGLPNFGLPDAPKGQGIGGALFVDPNATCRVAGNIFDASSPNSIEGGASDFGSNLSSDDSATLTNSTSIRSTDPQLGIYGMHGGVVPTIIPLPNSLVIDAAQNIAFPTIDARGIARPQGKAADLGAVEAGNGFLRLTVAGLNPNFPLALSVGPISTSFSNSPISIGPFLWDNYDVSLDSTTYLTEPAQSFRLFLDVPIYDVAVKAYQKGMIYLEMGATNILNFAPPTPVAFDAEASRNLVDWASLGQFQTNVSGVLSLPLSPSISTNYLFFRSERGN